MIANKCSELGCMNKVGYACKCTSPETLSCEVHALKHINIPNKSHHLESILMRSCEGTKEAILEFLTKENSKYSELRRKTIDSFSKRFSNLEKELKDFTRKLDCYSGETNDLFVKISQANKLEQDPISELLILQPREAVEKVKLMTIASRDWYNCAKLYYIFNEKLESLNRSFIKEKCDVYLESKNMQNSPEIHNKPSQPASIELANVKDSISLINEKEFENLKELINKNSESETSLPNSQTSIDNNYPKRKLEDIETLRNKTADLLSRPNNQELEIDFRATCSAYQITLDDPQRIQAYQDYLNAYQQKTSLYNLNKSVKNSTELIIYNTETETKEKKILETPEPLDYGTCITKLPNGKLFCFGSNRLSGLTVLIDVNSGFEVLPSGTPCKCSSCIYFKSSVYCFGGYNNNASTLSSRFDLDQNRWIQLTPMPKGDGNCNSIIFNGNILISGFENSNLLRYSLDSNSFSTIPYDFERNKRKILINAERLYLIECPYGLICESEIGSDTNWRQIRKSAIYIVPAQVFCSYNKGAIYIALNIYAATFFKFDLNEKRLTEIKKFKMAN